MSSSLLPQLDMDLIYKLLQLLFQRLITPEKISIYLRYIPEYVTVRSLMEESNLWEFLYYWVIASIKVSNRFMLSNMAFGELEGKLPVESDMIFHDISRVPCSLKYLVYYAE